MSRRTKDVNTTPIQHRRAFISLTTSGVRDKALELARPEARRVLDVGCGNALFFVQLLADGRGPACCVGLDYSWKNLEEARDLFRANRTPDCPLVRGDAFQLPFPPGTFDQVFCLNVFINRADFEEIETLFAELVRVCAPGGRVVFEFRNAQNPLMWFRCWRHNRRGGFRTNAYRYERFADLLARQGLRVVRVKAVGPPFRWLALAYLVEAEREVPGGRR